MSLADWIAVIEKVRAVSVVESLLRRVQLEVSYAAFNAAAALARLIEEGAAESIKTMALGAKEELDAGRAERVARARRRANLERSAEAEAADVAKLKAEAELAELSVEAKREKIEHARKRNALELEERQVDITKKLLEIQVARQQACISRLADVISRIRQSGGQVAFDPDNLKLIIEAWLSHAPGRDGNRQGERPPEIESERESDDDDELDDGPWPAS